jgi:hypothetical protein
VFSICDWRHFSVTRHWLFCLTYFRNYPWFLDWKRIYPIYVNITSYSISRVQASYP